MGGKVFIGMRQFTVLLALGLALSPCKGFAETPFIAVGTVQVDFVGYDEQKSDGVSFTHRSKAYFIGVNGGLAVFEFSREGLNTFYSFLGLTRQSDLGSKQRVVTNLTAILPNMGREQSYATAILRYESHLGRDDLVLRGTVVTRDTVPPPKTGDIAVVPPEHQPFVGHVSRTFKFAATKDRNFSELVAKSTTLDEAVKAAAHVLLGLPAQLELKLGEQWAAAP